MRAAGRPLGLALLVLACASGRGWARASEPAEAASVDCGSTDGLEIGPRLGRWVAMRQAKCAKIEPYRGTFLERQIPALRANTRSLPLPRERPAYLMVRIRTVAAGLEGWKKAVDVYLRTEERRISVVGVEREG